MGKPSTKKFTASQSEIIKEIKEKVQRKPFTFRLEEGLIDDLGKHCKTFDLTKTEIIEYLVRKYLGK